MTFLNYVKLDKSLPDLKYAHKEDGCFDFVAGIDITIPPKTETPIMVQTGMKFEVPVGYELQVRSRSGLATKGIMVFNSPGTIDTNFANEVMVLLMNHSKTPFHIKKGDRIAQGKLAIKPTVILKEVDEIMVRGRGMNGLGSSGM